jgi:DNA mismatch repair ATPase MutS
VVVPSITFLGTLIHPRAFSETTNAAGIMQRAITRFVSPGTVVDESLLDQGARNHLAALVIDWETAVAALAIAEVSTGLFEVASVDLEHLDEFLSRFEPSELLVSAQLLTELQDGHMQSGTVVKSLLRRLPVDAWTALPGEFFSTTISNYDRDCHVDSSAWSVYGGLEPHVRAAALALFRYAREMMRESFPKSLTVPGTYCNAESVEVCPVDRSCKSRQLICT